MRHGPKASANKDPKADAETAGLAYIGDTVPGIHRQGRPGRFRYKDSRNRSVGDAKTLARIRRLAIPPAWTDVWIAPSSNAHLQATGRDAKGRKQYRYHPDFAAIRDSHKFAHLAEFAAGLPLLRRRLKQDLRRPGLCREKVIAAIITLLEGTLIRIGNEDYARSNASYGLTTLRNRHVKIRGAQLRFLFKGKSGKQWSLAVADRRVAKVVRNCQELPGQHLFEYRGDDGACQAISSSDVNAYLRQVSGRDITAKDFRTWAGTVKAAMRLHHASGAPVGKLLRETISAVAAELGNTAAVCRKCYIHPRIIAEFESGKFRLRIPARARNGLMPYEIAVLAVLRRDGSMR